MKTLSPRERKIYDILQDEKSKNILIARSEYAKEKGSSFSLNPDITDFFYDVFEKTDEWHRVLYKLRNGKYVLYGAGERSKRILHMLKHYQCLENCIEIWDANSSLHGKIIDNIRISPPPPVSRNAGKIPFDNVLIGVKGLQAADLSQSYGIPLNTILQSETLLTNLKEQYFDSDIIIPRLSDSEIFIDAGCYDFQTSELLLKYAPGVKKYMHLNHSRNRFRLLKKRLPARARRIFMLRIVRYMIAQAP